MLRGLSRHKPFVSERQSLRFASCHALGTLYLFHGPAHHQPCSHFASLRVTKALPFVEFHAPVTAKELNEAMAI